MPVPPLTSGASQVPHGRMSPHPSDMKPHSAPSPRHVLGVHTPTPQRLGTPPPPHVSPTPVHSLPHVSTLPQSSRIMPHSAPCCSHVIAGVQPHFRGSPPPPHVDGGAHAPQLSWPSHPLSCTPHSAPRSSQLLGPHMQRNPAPS